MYEEVTLYFGEEEKAELRKQGRYRRTVENDFLHNMARIIAGVLIEVGEEVQEPSVIEEIFESKSRKEEIEMADAKGLFLQEIEYD